jgi:beta-mannosidase
MRTEQRFKSTKTLISRNLLIQLSKLVILFFFLICFLACKKNQPAHSSSMVLKTNWEFRQAGKKDWMKAIVPGTVHQDLLANGIIKDPFKELNEFDQQWIENEDWEYKTKFSVTKEQLAQENKELIFKGLDTYATVFLNDSLILNADNMFRSWEADCKKFLKEGDNELRIVFASPVKIGGGKLNKQGFLIPVQNEQAPKGKQNSVYTRKAAYHYGWDWGPRLVTSGIWQPVYLKTWSAAKIKDVFLQQKNISKEQATYISTIEIIANRNGEAELQISIDGNKNKTEKISLKKGNNILSFDFIIDKPELWWTAGLGKHKLYTIKTSLALEGKEIDSKETKLGVRTLKVIQQPDSLGKSFYVELNGVPVFMKGADYIPGDNLIPRVDSAKYERVIDEALSANMNILRVWGGAVYEVDYFYDLCSEKGILLYHDFMFACSMYPGDDAIAENIRLEAEEQVKRLRNYPNIMLWAGNNEILNGWNEWHFQERFGYNDQQKDTLWKYYTKIFYEVLPTAVKKYDPEKLYWSCSPQSAHGVLQNPYSGDQHFWPVWFGDQPFTAYEQQPGRFISEYGFQSYPCINTLKKITSSDNFSIDSEVLHKRQRSPMDGLCKGCNGNEVIDRYMKREFTNPKDFDSYVYVSQLLHAQAIRTAAEAHRRNKPYTMGSMYWQINDCWPTISWSTVDYFGNWKAGHYQARNSYKDFLISTTRKDNTIKIYLVSDRLLNTKAELKIKAFNFHGQEIFKDSLAITVSANSSAVFFEKKVRELLSGKKMNEVYLHIELFENKNLLAENNYFFVAHKSLVLPKAKVEANISKDGDVYTLNVKTDAFAKNVYVYFDGIDANLSDNFFDLNAKTEKTITFKNKETISIEALSAKMKILTLANTY